MNLGARVLKKSSILAKEMAAGHSSVDNMKARGKTKLRVKIFRKVPEREKKRIGKISSFSMDKVIYGNEKHGNLCDSKIKYYKLN